jgi:hypothetical protein
LDVKRDELPALNYGNAQQLVHDIERLMNQLSLSHAS